MKKKGLLILGLIVTILSTSVFSQKLGATSIEEEKKKQQEMESQLADSKVILEELNKLKSDTDTYIAALDEKLNAIVKNVEELKTKMSDKQEEIDETNKEIKKQEKDIKEQYESMKKRIQFLFENGETYYFDMLLGSESVSDFLNKAEYLSDITTYDRNMLDKMKESKKKVVETRNRLKEEKAELSSLKKDAEKKQKTMEALIEDKQAELAKTESEIQLKQTEILNREEEIQAQKSLVEEMEAIEARRRAEEARRKAEEARRKAEEERRRQEEESRRAEEESRRLAEKENDGSDSDDEDRDDTYEEETEESTEQYDDSDWDDDYYSGEYGEFTWPLPGNYSITSEYGTRVDPIDGSVAYHNGLDIGASTGTPIHAIASGQVAWAYYSTTAGNWIGIDHGDGLYSIYMHSSQLLVSEGDMVSAGDVIALVGSTGRSTGPHLHLSVRLNGEYVNPWNYIQ